MTYGTHIRDVERKGKYYHIITYPERTLNFTSRKKRTSENNSEFFFHKSGSANEQHTNQPICYKIGSNNNSYKIV